MDSKRSISESRMRSRREYFTTLILMHFLVIMTMLLVVIMSGADYRELLLVDDGYYNIAEGFVRGETLLHKFRGPVIPLIYSILFVFPTSAHPFVRLLISLIFSVGTMTVLFEIVKRYLSERAFFLGSAIFLLNPVYNHWVLKSSPEIYLAFFLGLFILNVVYYFETSKIRYLLYACLIFSISFFVKPVFLFIPIFMFFAAILIKSRRFVVVSLFLLILGTCAYGVQDGITKVKYNPSVKRLERKYDYIHKTLLIADTYWVDYVLRTKQFSKSTILGYGVPYRDGKSLSQYSIDWVKDFYKKYPKGSLVFMNLYFVYREPILVIQKLLISPFFYFAMSAREEETFVKLFFSIVSITLSIIGLRRIYRSSENKNEIKLIVSILLGFVALHLVTHTMNRYSLPILPYLYVWGGIPLLWLMSLLSRMSHRRHSSVKCDE